MSDSQAYLQRVNAALGDIVSFVGPQLSSAEREEVGDLARHLEYGLALQTLVEILIEEGKTVTRQTYTMVENLAGLMQSTDLDQLQRLRSRVDR